MNFTAGLLLLFLNVFLPGLIFLRFYYIGEFSKQFSTRIPIIRLGFYALIPGILVQSLAIYLYSCIETEFSLSGALDVYLDLLNPKDHFKEQTSLFLNNISKYIIYCVLVSGSALVLGSTLHYTIRKLKWDIKFKMLRFRNHWYYVFNGEIQQFTKFTKATKKLNKTITLEHPDAMMCYADILVSNNGITNMYTGYIVDYELDSKDHSQLDKLYLIDVQKYIYPNKSEDNTELLSKYEKVLIPGDLFIIDNNQVLNMNLTYIPSLPQKNRLQSKKIRRQLMLESISANISFILLVVISIQIFFAPFKIPELVAFTSKFNWLEKILFIISLLMALAFLFYDKKAKLAAPKTYKLIGVTSIVYFCLSIIYITLKGLYF